MKVKLSSRNTFIYLLHIFCGILYFIYKGSKLGLTSKRKPALTRPRSAAPRRAAPLSTGFIAKVQFIVEIIPHRTHARRLTITFFHRLTMSCPFDSRRTRIRGMYPSSCSLCSGRESEKRNAISTRAACVTSIREKDQENGRMGWWVKKKKCRCAKEENGTERGINCTSDADLFEHDTLRWYVMRLGVNRRARDTFERRRHFCSTDNAYSRDLTRESVAVAVVENHREGKRKSERGGERRERDSFSQYDELALIRRW